MAEPHRLLQLVRLTRLKARTTGSGAGCGRLGLRPGRTAFLSATVRVILLPFLLLPYGCATLPPLPSAETRAEVRAIAIAPARYAPNSNFLDIAKGKLSEGEAGVLFGGSAAFAAGGLTLAAGPAVGVLGLLYTVVWTSAGVQPSAPKGKAREIRQAIADAVVALDAPQTLARRLASTLQKEPALRVHPVAARGPEAPAERPSYADVKTEGVDAVLEISVTEVGFEVCASPLVYPACPGKPANPLISLLVKSHARLVRVADGTELYARTFWYESRPRTIQEWAENGGQPLTRAFELGWSDLAGRIVDELFLVAPVPLPTPGSFATRWNPYAGHCWLRPVYPLKPQVDSRRPQLRWESFPRALDRERGDPALIAKIRDVTYDLKIWEADGEAPGTLLYERIGLPEPLHRVESGLEPGRTYFWSFRARFTVDGRPMATRWASGSFSGSWEHGPRDEQGAHLLEACHSDQISFHNYYRFVTPEN